MNEIFLIDKPSGVTSFGALNPIKRALGTGKVGHAGTLDKFANGLLIVLSGKMLKKQNDFMHLDKKYEASIFFGKETDTLDPEGQEIAAAPPPSLAELENALPSFRGTIMQEPPAYSALHIDGKRAYQVARGGGAPLMKAREVVIYSLELLSYQAPFAKIAVHCSSGTYIRSLARDIALAAHSRAYTAALTRRAIGGYRLEDAVQLESFGEWLSKAALL